MGHVQAEFSLLKNQKQALIQNAQTLPEETSKDCERMYQIHKKTAMDYFDSLKDTRKGKLACFIEKHISIPVYRINYITNVHTEGDEHVIFMHEQDGNIAFRFNTSSLPYLTFFKSLFV
jgi:hypothetical protein